MRGPVRVALGRRQGLPPGLHGREAPALPRGDRHLPHLCLRQRGRCPRRPAALLVRQWQPLGAGELGDCAGHERGECSCAGAAGAAAVAVHVVSADSSRCSSPTPPGASLAQPANGCATSATNTAWAGPCPRPRGTSPAAGAPSPRYQVLVLVSVLARSLERSQKPPGNSPLLEEVLNAGQ
jgi:hypothetical protein